MSETKIDESNESPAQTPPPPPAPLIPDPTDSLASRDQQALDALTPERRGEIVELKSQGYGTRRIAPRLLLSRHVVREVLRQEGLTTASCGPSKLEPYLPLVEAKVGLRLTCSRILRELRQAGYQGGRTILARKVRELRARTGIVSTKPIKRRFETRPGEEIQIDWSPYQVPIGGALIHVHALGTLLAASRKLSLRFFRDERQATLLEGLASAFEYLDGCAHRLVLDNMATAVLGRLGPDRKILWHPRFLEFCAYYGCEPFACQVNDPDRKGKKEKSFRLVWDDFLKGATFESWDDLDRARRAWLDETPGAGNQRVHGTTLRVPNEAWQEERQVLIRLPAERFAVHEQSVRMVDQDSTLSVHGTRYTVPTTLANRAVAVRIFTEHFEVLDQHGRIAFSRRYVADADKGKLIIDPTHYANLPRRRDGARTGERLDEAFIRRFPVLEALVDGLKLRMKTLAPVHLRALIRLADEYGEPAFLAAARHAMQYRSFSATAVQRILEQEQPHVVHEGEPPLGGIGPAILGDVDPSSLDGYRALDCTPAAQPSTASEEDDHGA